MVGSTNRVTSPPGRLLQAGGHSGGANGIAPNSDEQSGEVSWLQAILGSVDSGKIADLVLLTADPLEDIRNTQKISSVLAHGRFLDRAALDRILMQVEAAAKQQK